LKRRNVFFERISLNLALVAPICTIMQPAIQLRTQVCRYWQII